MKKMTMNKVNEGNSDINCVHQKSRRRILEGPLMDARESNLQTLPPNGLQHILSFITNEKMCQMRQVCKVFNETCKKLLDKEHKQLIRRLETEMERAEQRVLFPNNARSSYNMLHFLNGLHEAINNCTITYCFHADYFVAGKLLDEANCLLMDFNSTTVVPYFQDHAYNQQPHPLLGPIIAASERAYRDYKNKILGSFYWHGRYYGIEQVRRDVQKYRKLVMLGEGYRRKMKKLNWLKNRKENTDRGNEMSGRLLTLVLKLNDEVLDLTGWAKKVDEEAERAISTENNSRNNIRSFQASIGSPLRTKVTGINPNGSKRSINLASLPSVCVQKIVSYLNFEKMARLRILCKIFNEVGKKELTRNVEYLKWIFDLEMEKLEIQYNMQNTFELCAWKINMTRDLYGIFKLCKDNYRKHLGSNYYFIAGKVLDEAKHVFCDLFDLYDENDPDNFYFEHVDLYHDYKCRPHFALFPLINMVYKAVAHFKFKVVPEYFPTTRIYVPDFIITGGAMSFENEKQLEEIEEPIEANVKIKKQNDRNGKLLKTISSLKKKVNVLNNKISEKNGCIEKLIELKFKT